jgi:hypothetical protein
VEIQGLRILSDGNGNVFTERGIRVNVPPEICNEFHGIPLEMILNG